MPHPLIAHPEEQHTASLATSNPFLHTNHRRPSESYRPVANDGDDEVLYLTRLVYGMGLFLFVPAVVLALFLYLNPESLTTSHSHRYDFSSWQVGELPTRVVTMND